MGVEASTYIQNIITELEAILKQTPAQSEQPGTEVDPVVAYEEIVKIVGELNASLSPEHQLSLKRHDEQDWGDAGAFVTVALSVGKVIDIVPFHFLSKLPKPGEKELGQRSFSTAEILTKLIKHFNSDRSEQ